MKSARDTGSFRRFAVAGLLAIATLLGAHRAHAQQVALELRAYRVTDATPELLAAAERMETARSLTLDGTEPRFAYTARARAGEAVQINQGRISGTVAVQPEGSDAVVTLQLDGFFKGTPLRIPTCRPHVVVRSRMRVQGRTQLDLRVIMVRDGSCHATP